MSKKSMCKISNINLGNDLILSSESQNTNIFQYLPSDISLLNQHYKKNSTSIYVGNLSPSIIYSGVDLSSGVKVAIKELRKDRLKEEIMVEMARTEFSIHSYLSKLSTNIVEVKDYYEDEKIFYLVMEFSEEPDYFEDLLENRYCPVADERTLKAFAFDILTGLKEIHKYNIVHCDIKPQNFLVFKNLTQDALEGQEIQNECEEEDLDYDDYYLKITDFGFAHVIPNGQDKVFMKYPCGTYSYMAPEITKVGS
jgi:serine/threonine protein kinase